MFHLPKQVIQQQNKKSPTTKEQINQTENKKHTNINQIKQQIQNILKRNNHSPFYLRQNQKSQKYLHSQTLQKKCSKVSIKATQQYVQMAKDNKKLYEEFLFGSDTSLKYNKKSPNYNKSKQNLSITMKERSYHKEVSPYLLNMLKDNAKSHRTISFSQNGKQTKYSLHNVAQNDRTVFEKVLISTSNDIKFRRTNLMSGKRKSDQQNIFKDTAKNTFYGPHNFDFARYLKNNHNFSFDAESKEMLIFSKQQKSFEIAKKQIISKRSSASQERQQKITEFPKILTKPRIQQTQQKNPEKCHKKSQHYQVKVTRQQKQEPILSASLNVIDDQLLIYYGKLKNRRIGNVDNNEGNRKSHIHKIWPKDENMKTKQVTKNIKMGPITSKELIKRVQIQSSWKTHRLDPWKMKQLNEDADEESIFDNLEDKIFSQQLSPFQLQ